MRLLSRFREIRHEALMCCKDPFARPTGEIVSIEASWDPPQPDVLGDDGYVFVEIPERFLGLPKAEHVAAIRAVRAETGLDRVTATRSLL